MKSRTLMGLALVGLLATAAQGADDPAFTHRAAAKAAAGLDFPGTLARLCITPDNTLPRTPRPPGPRAIPDRASWYAEPARMFDNLYFVGTKIHSAWALKTSAGIIIIDTLYDYAAEPEIVDGLKKLGLNPADIKYVIISHGHGDHDQGARLLQDRFGAKIVMGGPDWDAVERDTAMPGGVPHRDIAPTDGQKLTLGDTTVTIVQTPGHTPGTLSLLFPVRDRGRTLTVAYNGGTAFNFPNDKAHYETYLASQLKFAKAAADANAVILMTNHSEFDDAWERSRLVSLRKPGEEHPYVLGADAVRRYYVVTSECTRAELLRFP
jgi:metallo-beta-lactamase class B